MNKEIFDLWAGNYDKDVRLTDEKNAYPFAGYKKVLEFIYKEVRNSNGRDLLDIGFGTGILTRKFYKDGYRITGLDFSDEMIKIAREKMPDSRLIKCDFSKGLPLDILNRSYDFILSSYAIHHLKDQKKVEFLNQLYDLLNPKGKIIIGDVSFTTRKKLEECRRASKDSWDDGEDYMVYDDLKSELKGKKISFYEISFCSGVLVLEK